jgi:hypothetical protein
MSDIDVSPVDEVGDDEGIDDAATTDDGDAESTSIDVDVVDDAGDEPGTTTSEARKAANRRRSVSNPSCTLSTTA